MDSSNHIVIVGQKTRRFFLIPEIHDLARMVGVKRGTRVRFKTLPLSYARDGDAQFDYERGEGFLIRCKSGFGPHVMRVVLLHEFTHVAQAQKESDDPQTGYEEFMRKYHAFSTSAPRIRAGGKSFDSYNNNPFEVEARENAKL